MSFSNLIFALILELHEKHFYHLEDSKPVFFLSLHYLLIQWFLILKISEHVL